MTILSLQKIEKSFGTNLLFDNASFEVGLDDRIGLIGANGSGKTTLFRIITGHEQEDSGVVSKSRDMKIGYMEQYVIRNSEHTVYNEVLNVFSQLSGMETALSQIHRQIDILGNETNSVLLEQQMHVQEAFEREGGLTYKSRTRSVLMGLGYCEAELEKPVNILSGGEKSKLQLAKLLLSDANLLLLDEPTNHLDLDSVVWLEKYLTDYRGAFIIISHDRYFLDKITARTVEIENRRIISYYGNYSVFLKKKEQVRLAALKKYEQTLDEINRIEKIIEQQKRFNQAENYVTIASKRKSIERLQATLEKPDISPTGLRFQFRPKGKSGNDVLLAENLSLVLGGKTLFENTGLDIKKGERVFLLGANGSGKTSLFKCLLGEYDTGDASIRLGTGVTVGYYDQVQSGLHFDKQVVDEVWDEYPTLTETQVRTALGQFLFTGDDVFKPVKTLSGGERARLALLKLMLGGANLLLLDEPTNHLDMLSREALENALSDYGGTLLVISHDRYLINKMATRIYELSCGKLSEYCGNYDYYLEKRENEPNNVPVKTVTIKSAGESYRQKRERESEKRKLQGKIERTMALIEKLEKRQSEITEQLQIPEIASDYEKTLALAKEHEQLDNELDEAFKNWEALTEQMETCGVNN